MFWSQCDHICWDRYKDCGSSRGQSPLFLGLLKMLAPVGVPGFPVSGFFLWSTQTDEGQPPARLLQALTLLSLRIVLAGLPGSPPLSQTASSPKVGYPRLGGQPHPPSHQVPQDLLSPWGLSRPHQLLLAGLPGLCNCLDPTWPTASPAIPWSPEAQRGAGWSSRTRLLKEPKVA